MDGYEAEIRSLRNAGSAARDAGELAAPVGPGSADAITALTEAMPGSRSSLVAAALAVTWESQVGAWVEQINGYGDNLHSTADLYEANEQEADDAFFTLRDVLGWGND